MLAHKPESAAKPPASLAGIENGRIPPALLKPCGIKRFVMVEPAATALANMVKAARADGIRLSATGTYRSYGAQLSLFLKRYSTTPTYDGAPSKQWDGKTWYLRKGCAGAATPGHSNHGWGIAVDLARVNRYGRVVRLDTGTLEWLDRHGPAHGYWNTVTSENWHWSYCR